MELSTITKIGKILNLVESAVDVVLDVISPRKAMVGLCIPPGSGKSFVTSVLDSSDEYYIIDLDKETISDLDNDEKNEILNQNEMKINRLIYTKSKLIIAENLDILM